MIEVLCFLTEVKLANTAVENYLQEKFGLTKFVWIENFYEFCTENNVDEDITYIQVNLQTGNQGFKYEYSIYNRRFSGLTLSNKIHAMMDLALREGISILSSDDEINPRTWVLTEPDGKIASVETNDDGTIAEAYFNFPFGDFRTKNKLSEDNLDLLKHTISELNADVQIEYATDGPVINGAFNKVQQNFKALAGFIHHYEILPQGKNTWLDIEAKSIYLISYMAEFHEQTAIDLCVFPRNYCEIKGIEGGSDSEEHCIVLSNKKQEKIIYKPRRKSWLK